MHRRMRRRPAELVHGQGRYRSPVIRTGPVRRLRPAPRGRPVARGERQAGSGEEGNDLIYTLRVTNGGPDLASRVVLTDVLPGSVKLESATATQGTCTARGKKGGTVNCQLGDEANGQTVTVTIIGRATGKGAISNKATVMAAAPPDPATASNTAIETTTVAR